VLGDAEEMGIYRGEVASIIWALADLRVRVDKVLELLEEEDGEEEEEQEGDL